MCLWGAPTPVYKGGEEGEEASLLGAPQGECPYPYDYVSFFGDCRGIVTADVLELGLSRGAIAARKLEGVNRDKEPEGYTGSAPYGEGKSLRPVEVVSIRVSTTKS